MNTEKREVEIDLLQLARALWENAKYILIVTVAFGLIGLIGSSVFLTPVYEARAKMIVNTRKDESQIVTNDQLNSAKNLVDTYAIIIRSRDVLNRVISDLKLTENYSALARAVTVQAVNDTQVMEIVVQHENRATALSVAEKILELAPAVIVETVEAGSVKPVEQAYSGMSPVSPSIPKNTLMAALGGFVLSCVIIAIICLADNTYKTDMDIQNDLNIPVLGIIPSVESCHRSAKYKSGYPAKGVE